MFNATKTFLLASILATLLPVTAVADMDSFKKAYQDYNDAVQHKDWSAALSGAEQSLNEGLAIFDANGQNVANLRLNYARELDRAGQSDKAAEQLRLCLDANEKMHGADSDDVLGVLMELGKVTTGSDNVAAQQYFERAIGIVNKGHDDALAAKLKLTAGLSMVQQNIYAPAQPWLEDAHMFYVKTFGPHDARAGLAALNLGKVYMAQGDKDNAVTVLEGALKAFGGKDTMSRQLDVGTRRLLVPLLESTGHHSEATPHCVAIALAGANNGNAAPQLLYSDPKGALLKVGTRDAQGKEVAGETGQVMLSYTVDATGQPVDISVKSSNNREMNDSAIEIVKTFRYAPAVSHGKPVATPNLTYEYNMKNKVSVTVQH